MRTFLLGTILALCGCGGGHAPTKLVTGKVMRGGSQLVPTAGETLRVTFVSEDGLVPGTLFPATIKPDGGFEVPGPQGSGIPAGRYRISVELLAGGAKPSDRLGNAFSLARTPFVRSVSPGQEVVLDLDAKP